VAKSRAKVLRILEEIEIRTLMQHWFPEDYGQVVELFCPEFLMR